MIKYNYAKLRGRIVEICGNNREFAKAMDLSEHSMSRKLASEIPFKQTEITKAVAVLDIKDTDIKDYFFTLVVQND